MNPPLSSEHRMGVGTGIILSVVTLGLYNIWWNYRQMRALNSLLGREEYNFWKWLVLSILTLGIYHVYYEYRMGSDLHAWIKNSGRPVADYLPALGLGLACLGLTVVTDAVYQVEINKLT